MSYPSRFTIMWGPALWRVMHSVSFNYPLEPTVTDKKHYRTFFESLAHVIPCPACATHYREYFEKNPIALENRNSLALWVYDLHNHVTASKPVAERRAGKPPSFEEVTDFYTNWSDSRARSFLAMSQRGRENALASPYMEESPESTTLITIIIVVIGLIAAALAYYYYVYKK